uniref:L3125 protein n=1 Tax=Saccharomyces cerevisiae TaxID=4932 RepID=E9PA99_YEASX|nr:L3125 [Saccharomyces cerevisiae]
MWMGSVSSCSCDIVETVETTDSLFLWIGDNCVLGVNVPAAYRSSLLLSVPTRKGDLKLFPFILGEILSPPGEVFSNRRNMLSPVLFFLSLLFLSLVLLWSL